MEPPAPSLKQASLLVDVLTPEFGRPLDAPKSRSTAKPTKGSPVGEDKVGDYRHADATRTNIPEEGLATQDRLPTAKVTYAFDPHLDPQLVWAGKAEHTNFDVDTVSLHIYERIMCGETHQSPISLSREPTTYRLALVSPIGRR